MVVLHDQNFDSDPSKFAACITAGLLVEIYSWHIDEFFHPKKPCICSAVIPPLAAEVADVLL